jgi:hypothetical protein
MSLCGIVEVSNSADVISFPCLGLPTKCVPTAELTCAKTMRKRAVSAVPRSVLRVWIFTEECMRSLKGEPCQSAIFKS